ncbi:MAG: cohesin domain-containing protein [candidate division Zixibacteria bacterium]|nr:cohesin domain-containing protein [candidate division Zixibacteria bacterium]
MMFKYITVALGTMLLFGGRVSAVSDPFGALDLVYVDSVQTTAGGQAAVRFSLRNDELISSISIPIIYDTALLQLDSIHFLGSRVSYIATRITNPELAQNTNGHFVVAVIKIFESPLAVGDGLIFTALFTVKLSAAAGAVAKIDSLFYPPGGELLLVEATTNGPIRPAFAQGKVVVKHVNRPPTIASMNDQSIMEGDSLVLTVGAADIDLDNLSLSVTSKPVGATFIDNGDGTGRFSWRPDYVGPYSSAGSPFTVTFRASDGNRFTQQQIQINVTNKNRRPVVTSPATITVDAGSLVTFALSAVDLDFEAISWTIINKPTAATFTPGNPSNFNWNSTIVDSGEYNVMIVASDPTGAADSAQISVRINPVNIYTLSIDTVEVYPGETATIEVHLDNKVPITGFNILFNYDPSALFLASLTKTGTRAAAFEYFTYTNNASGRPGDLRIIGTADITAPLGGVLTSGNGAIAKMTFATSGDIGLGGLSVPLAFKYLDFEQNDNTLVDSLGVKISREQIFYLNGRVAFESVGAINRGDINLNGLAFEIGDAIYFSNFLINPFSYSFNALQYANSDVNNDNLAATISDLVLLIKTVVSGGPRREFNSSAELTAQISIEAEAHRTTVFSSADFELGGVYIQIPLAEGTDPQITGLQPNMTCTAEQIGGMLNVLVYSLEANSIAAGYSPLFSIEGMSSESFSFEKVELSSSEGRAVTALHSTTVTTLPTEFILMQNYPNPFNPSTSINFALPRASRVELTIFNIAGQKIRSLVDDDLSAGSHTVVWDGHGENGASVSSGVYLYRLVAGTESSTKKMLLVK